MINNTYLQRLGQRKEAEEEKLEVVVRSAIVALTNLSRPLDIEYQRDIEDISTRTHRGSRYEDVTLRYIPSKKELRGKIRKEKSLHPRGGIYSALYDSEFFRGRGHNVSFSLRNLRILSRFIDINHFRLQVDYHILCQQIADELDKVSKSLSRTEGVKEVKVTKVDIQDHNRKGYYEVCYRGRDYQDSSGVSHPSNSLVFYSRASSYGSWHNEFILGKQTNRNLTSTIRESLVGFRDPFGSDESALKLRMKIAEKMLKELR